MPSDSTRKPESDYGSDFASDDEQALNQLASGTLALAERDSPGLNSVIDAVPGKTDDHRRPDASRLHHNRGNTRASTERSGPQSEQDDKLEAHVSISPGKLINYPDLSRALLDLPPEASDASPGTADTPAPRPDDQDERSPLQRFRSYPRRPLTVSDLTSGAWCELQYWYTLTRLPGGRRTRTAAMRQGSKVHQKLEDEVHTTVKVEILSKEDAFGLKLWNLVQGLRTLRETGLTRELEVWGFVDGNLVNGVIDSVSCKNPNPEFEEELSSQGSQSDPKQMRLADFFPPIRKRKKTQPSPKIYLTDVKTRGSLAPVSKALLRPAIIQLLLYHRLLSDMAADRLDYLKVLRRYGLDPDAPFSDTFIAQIGGLHDEMFEDTSSTQGSHRKQTQAFDDTDASYGYEPGLVKYSCIRELLPLIKDEIRLAFSEGEESLGHILRVQHIYRGDGRELGIHDFPVSKQALADYLDKYMAWWRGERPARGVEIEEAFKCNTCEFGADCTWRQARNDERVRQSREKMQASKASRPSIPSSKHE